MFNRFPGDPICWELEDQYMFGPDYLVVPILELGRLEQTVYLPAGTWRLTSTGENFTGPQTVRVDVPLDYMPVFRRMW